MITEKLKGEENLVMSVPSSSLGPNSGAHVSHFATDAPFLDDANTHSLFTFTPALSTLSPYSGAITPSRAASYVPAGGGGYGAAASPFNAAPSVVIGAKAFCNPNNWGKEFAALITGAVKKKDQACLTHDARSKLNSQGTLLRIACCVRVIPRLDVIKLALRRVAAQNAKDRYTLWEEAITIGGGGGPSQSQSVLSSSTAAVEAEARDVSSRKFPRARGNGRSGGGRRGCDGEEDSSSQIYMSNPSIWTVEGVNDSEIVVCDAINGRKLMRISDSKTNASITTLMHAPFRGLMDRSLKVLSVYEPQDLLRIKEKRLVNTDYVWVGFSDGSIRLFPSDPNRVRETDRSIQICKGELADLVFELPKFHAGALVAITRSPCHQDREGADLSTAGRLSSAITYMTAASRASGTHAREHLSLMCTASVDSNIVVWDVTKIYQTIEAMRAQATETARASRYSGGSSGMGGGGNGSAAKASAFTSEVITLEGLNSPAFTVRSSCSLVKVRPLLRLKGGVAGLRTLQWCSTLVTSAGYQKQRLASAATRDPTEASAPALVRERREHQVTTRFERREEHRKILRLSEPSMKELEAELVRLMPPLALEPVQTLRVNLIVAGDSVGTVHIWNLDEELTKKPTADLRSPGRAGSTGTTTGQRTQRRPGDSPSRGDGADGHSPMSVYSRATSLSTYRGASPSVQMVAEERPKPPPHLDSTAQKATTKTLGKKKKRTTSLPSGSSRARLDSKATGPAVSGRASPCTPARQPSSAAFCADGGGDGGAERSSRAQTPEAPPLSPMQMLVLERAGGRGKSIANGATPAEGGGTAARARTPLTLADAKVSTRRVFTAAPVALLPRAPSTSATSAQQTKKSSVTPALSKASKGVSGKQLRTPKKASPARGGLSIARFSTPARANSYLEDEVDYNDGVSSQLSLMKTSTRMSASPAREKSQSPQASRSRHGGKSPSRGGSRGTTSQGGAAAATGQSLERQERQVTNDFLSRASTCRIEFTGGVAVRGMAVDVPPVVRTTLRRLPDPPERAISLLEEPTPEEVERRQLENQFDDLTEERALYFVFQQLQLYVSVEGTVLNLRCSPQWQLQDSDGRDLFRNRPAPCDEVDELMELHSDNAMSVAGHVEFPAFTIHLRKLILDAHSQPVTQLFLDHPRGHIWIARNDGLMTVFSTQSKQVVCRVPHPCADACLGAPKRLEWRKQQNEYLRSVANSSALKLEWHTETKGYPAGHFTMLVPFCKRTQVTVVAEVETQMQLKTAAADELKNKENVVDYSVWLEPNPFGFNNPHMIATQKLDGRSYLSDTARARERQLSVLLGDMLYYRNYADAVRRAQRRQYERYGKHIGRSVHYVIKEIGEYAQIPMLRHAYEKWRTHAKHFRSEHVLRRLRTARLQHAAQAAVACERVVRQNLLARYYVKWLRSCAERAAARQNEKLRVMLTGHFLPAAARENLTARPTGAMLEHLAKSYRLGSYYCQWRDVCEARKVKKQQNEVEVKGGERRGVAAFATPSVANSFVSDLGGTDSEFDGSMVLAATQVPAKQAATALFKPIDDTSVITRNAEVNDEDGSKHNSNNNINNGDGGDADEEAKGNNTTAIKHPYHYARRRAKQAAESTAAGVGGLTGDGETQQQVVTTPAYTADFLEIIRLLDTTRPAIVRFKDLDSYGDSVIDESWISIVESAEAGADVDNAEGKRFSVFRYGLLPLLQGLLSTADDVLPNLNDDTVADEVLSMLGGIELCLDYIAADAELLVLEDMVEAGVPVNPLFQVTRDSALQQVVEWYMDQALLDPECTEAMEEIAREKENLEAFVHFVTDERTARRRSKSNAIR